MSKTPQMERAQRHSVAFTGRLEPLDQEAEGGGAIDVDIVDLSTSGAGMTCKTSLQDGSTWRLRVDPELCEDFTETVVVRRCVQEGEGYRCGVQFVSAAALFKESDIGLDAAIQDLGTKRGRVLNDSSAQTPAPAGAMLRFGEDAVVEHMTNLQVASSQRLTVKADMLGCTAQLEGPLEVLGQITGGSIKTSDTIEVATLGQAGRRTNIVLGNFPKTNALVAQVPKQLEAFDTQIEDKAKELAYISNHGNEIGHTARERVMELEYELEEVRGKRALLQAKFDELLNHYRAQSEIGLRVHNAIEPGVVIECLTQKYPVARQLKGPLYISCAEDHTLKIELPGQSEVPLADALAAPVTS